MSIGEQLNLFDLVAVNPRPLKEEDKLVKKQTTSKRRKSTSGAKKENDPRLELAAYLLHADQLKGRSIYGFQISKDFRKLLLTLHGSLKSKTRYKGKTFFKIASVLYQDQLIHMHGNLNTIESNQLIWFYSYAPFDFSRLIDAIEDYVDDEFFQFRQLVTNLNNKNNWGSFVEIDLADLLEYEQYKTGFRVLEKYFLRHFTQKTFNLNGDDLTFYPVVAEGSNYVVSNPVFPFTKSEKTGKVKEFSPFSYAIGCRIEKRIGTSGVWVSFTANTKAWVRSNVSKYSNSFLSPALYTSVFLPLNVQTGDTHKGYIQLKVKRKGKMGEPDFKLEVEPSDTFYLKHYGLDLEFILNREMSKDYEQNPTPLTTINRYALKTYQPLEGQAKSIKRVERGVAPLDRRWFIHTIQEIFSDLYQVSEIKTNLQHYNKKLLKSNCLDNRIILPHSTHDVVKWGVFVEDKLKDILLAQCSELFTPLTEEGVFLVSERTQLKLVFGNPTLGNWGLMESKATFVKEKEKEVLAFLNANEDVAGCLIETERENSDISDLFDSKPFLRDFFAKRNIKTQFIHPELTEEEKKSFKDEDEKPNIEHAVNAALFDLLLDTGFEDGRAELIYNLCPIKTFLSVGKLNFKNGSTPILIKTKGLEAQYLVYPETEWKPLNEFSTYFSKQLIRNCHTYFENNASDKRKEGMYRWLAEATLCLHENSPFCVLWDRRVETLVPYPLNDSRGDWLCELFHSDFNQDAFVRWTPATYAPLSVQSGLYGGKDRVRHMVNYYSTSELPQHYFCYGKRNTPLRFTLGLTKKECPNKIAGMNAMIQLEIVQDCANETYHQGLITFLFGLRQCSLSTKDIKNYPKPMQPLEKIQKLIDDCERYQEMMKEKTSKNDSES